MSLLVLPLDHPLICMIAAWLYLSPAKLGRPSAFSPPSSPINSSWLSPSQVFLFTSISPPQLLLHTYSPSLPLLLYQLPLWPLSFLSLFLSLSHTHTNSNTLSPQALRDRIEALEKHLDVEWGATAGTGSIAELEQLGPITFHVFILFLSHFTSSLLRT